MLRHAHALLAEEFLDRAERGGIHGGHDPFHRMQIGQLHPLLAGEWVLGRDHHVQAVLVQGHMLDRRDALVVGQKRPRILGKNAEHDVHIALEQHRVERGVGPHFHGHHHVRSNAPQIADGARQDGAGRRNQRAHHNVPGRTGLEGVQVFREIAQLRQNHLGVVLEDLAEVGEPHALFAALEQRRTHLAFQVLDRLADRRLRHRQLTRCRQHRAGLDHLDEDGELLQTQPPRQ